MVQDILDKIASLSDGMSRLQKKLIEIANCGRLGPEIDRTMMDLGSVTLGLNSHEDFKRAIDKHFSLESGTNLKLSSEEARCSSQPYE